MYFNVFSHTNFSSRRNNVVFHSHRLCRRNVPDGDVLLFSLVVNGHVGGLVNLSRLQNQHLSPEKRRVSVPKAEYLVMRVWVFVSLCVCTGNLSRLVVPCVASTMMSIQKLSLSRWGECSTACFLNLWISCRFCTTDRKYLEGDIQKQSHLLYEYKNNGQGLRNTLNFLSLD